MRTNKIYEKSKKFIKENYKSIIFLIICILLATIRLDYEIYTPGGLSNLNKRIKVEDGYESEGSFNLTYVSSKTGTIPAILLSYIIPSWDLISIEEVRLNENEDYDDILKRGQIDLQSVNENAIAVAFKTAGEKYTITKNETQIYYKLEGSKTNLKTGDIIKTIEGKEITSLESVSEAYKDKKKGDKIEITVTRDGKEKNCYAILYEEDGQILIGITLVSVINVKTDKEVTFKYKGTESGASGGLMSALEIYNRITEYDLTKGKTISGTGTITLDGKVGEIAGVKYKLAGAVRKKADIFIVPSENYKEAIQLKEKNDYDITIIEADTFENVVKALKEID
ncbi:MAG: PDZ domain-containing protein [Bacilli bacterium]|nr:PDZ domain-containing protein [Bacilli bacterium]